MNRYKVDLSPPLWLLKSEIDQQQHDCIFGHACHIVLKQFTLIFLFAYVILCDGLHEDFKSQYLLQGLIG